ncbi:hypothetical protein [Mycobacterium dioxanotrophicus]|nr:hypothetical protein [Mycobacterium dioxanotrophicus]
MSDDVRAELTAKVHEALMDELVMDSDADADDVEAVLELAQRAVGVFMDPPCVEGLDHEWRRAAQTLVWSEIRNTSEGAESWNRWRVVAVCDHCGNPRVLDEWRLDG